MNSNGRPVTPPNVRFWRKVEKTESCWLWTGTTGTTGYGTFSPKRKTAMGAHKWLYEQVKGKVPKGMQLDHLCRTPRCVNPDHLEVVTPRENTRRGTSPAAVNAAKTHCKNGHEFTAENTYMQNGKHGPTRTCRICRNAYARNYQLNRRMAATVEHPYRKSRAKPNA